MSSLHKHCQHNDFSAVCLELQQSTAKINEACGERKLTPLIIACSYGHAAIARELLARQALTDLQDSEGRTALHHACLASNLDCCKALIKAKAPTDIPDAYGWGALQLAEARVLEGVRGAADIVRLLQPYPSCPPPPPLPPPPPPPPGHQQVVDQEDGGWGPTGNAAEWGGEIAPPAPPPPPPPPTFRTAAHPQPPPSQPIPPPPLPPIPPLYYPPIPPSAPDLSQETTVADATTPSIYVCPITQEVMNDPVFASDGFTYERQAIEGWLASHSTSPLTNIQLTSTSLIPNHSLRSAIIEWKERKRA